MSSLLSNYLKYTVLGLISASVVQGFWPKIGGRTTNWGLASGWQREIAIWDLVVSAVIVKSLHDDDESAARSIAGGMVILNVLLGTNHLLALRSDPTTTSHYALAGLNYLGVVVGSKALLGEAQRES